MSNDTNQKLLPAPALLDIRIIERKPNHFTVMVGENYENELCHDEVLNVVARVLYKGDRLRSADQHREATKYIMPSASPAEIEEWIKP